MPTISIGLRRLGGSGRRRAPNRIIWPIGSSVAEQRARQPPVDDATRGAVGEVASASENSRPRTIRSFERAEVVGADRPGRWPSSGRALTVRRPPARPHTLVNIAEGNRSAIPAAATPGSARSRARTPRKSPVRAPLVLHQARIDRDEQLLAVVAEARVGGRGLQRAADKQAARRQQHQRQRDLADDQQVARRQPAAAARRRRRRRPLEIGYEVGSRQLERRVRGPRALLPRRPDIVVTPGPWRRAGDRRRSPAASPRSAMPPAPPVAQDARSSPRRGPGERARTNPSVSSCRTIRAAAAAERQPDGDLLPPRRRRARAACSRCSDTR